MKGPLEPKVVGPHLAAGDIAILDNSAVHRAIETAACARDQLWNAIAQIIDASSYYECADYFALAEGNTS